MIITAAFRILLAGIVVAMPTFAIAQSSANFKSPAFSVNAGVGDMGSASFNARASVGQAFSPAALSSTNFSVATGLLAIPLATGTTANLPVFNTGVAANGSLLPGGSIDPHYTLIASAEPTLPGPNAIVTTNIADGFWIAQGPSSKWIAPSANQSFPGANPCNAAGSYTYRTLIDLTGFDPATAIIQGQWAVDNQGTAIRLNGVSIDLAQPSYNPFVAFNISSNFVAGVNTLDFVTSDQGCPNGLRVEFLSATASIATGGLTVPGAPTSLAGIAGNGQATFTFTAPASNGGSAITFYDIFCTPSVPLVTGPSSPITVTGLTNGTTYNCVAHASNAQGPSAASNAVNVTPMSGSLPSQTKVVSRKTHGSKGDHGLVLDAGQPIGGNVSVEPRSIGAGHQIVFTFDAPVVSHGVPSAFDENGAAIGTLIPTISGNDVLLTVTGVPDNKRVKFVLPGVNGGGDGAVSLGFLIGDVNNSRSVSSSDVQQMQAHSGQSVDATNFRFDLNATGTITAADVSAVKSRAPRALPEVSVLGVFTTQPANVAVTEGQAAQFVVAVAGMPAPTLQWQLSTDNGANWSNIVGEVNNVFNVVAAILANNGRRYRAVATNSAGSVNSNAATLTVNPAPLPKAWQPAALISPAIDGDVYNYQIAFSSNGDAMAVWQDLVSAVIATNIWANRYTPSTGWGTPTVIDSENGNAERPQVALDASGNAIVVWQQSIASLFPRNDIWSNRYVVGTGWSGAALLETADAGGADSPQIAVAANGQAIAAWSQRNANNSGADTVARSYHPATGWGATTTLATGTDAIIIVGGFSVVGNPGPAKVAMDAAGNSMAVWPQIAGAQINLVASRNSGIPEVVNANVGVFLGSYEVASNASGETVVVWGQSCIMWANRYVPGTGWGTATALQTGNPTCSIRPSIQVAVAANGNAIAAWLPGTGAMGSRYTAGNGWLGASQINNGSNFQFAMNPAGNTLAAWRSSSILAGNNDYVVEYNFFPSVQIYGGSGIDTTGLRMAMDASGNAIVLFKRADVAGRNTIWAAVYK